MLAASINRLSTAGNNESRGGSGGIDQGIASCLPIPLQAQYFVLTGGVTAIYWVPLLTVTTQT